MGKQQRKKAAVIDIARARRRRRLDRKEAAVQEVLEQNRQGLSRLFSTGLIFSRRGSQAGRDLLLVRHRLLRLSDALRRLAVDPGVARRADLDALDRDLDALLVRTGRLRDRTGELLAQL